MKRLPVGGISGCFVWLIAFGVLSICICPFSMVLAGALPVTSPEFVENTFGPYLCPAGSNAKISHYAITMINDTGIEVPATGYEMHCLSASGETVRGYEGTLVSR